MRVLWFEVTEPAAYVSNKVPIGGWQDSLERIVRTVPEIELTISFVSEKYSEAKVIDRVRYVPIYTKWSFIERCFKKYWDTYVDKVIPVVERIVENCKPDIIQIFGSEWPFGQIAAKTNVPVVIHIMGAVVPYKNAAYPPSYSYRDIACLYWWNPIKLLALWRNERNLNNWEQWERRTWKLVGNYMGRTKWDNALSRVMHPGRRYFHVEEALRPEFLNARNSWKLSNSAKIRIISTGCSTFWKGPDMMLKVALILTKLGIDFEWNVVGSMDNSLKQIVEKKERIRFEDCHINLLGLKEPVELLNLLCSSTLYVHTAYIENSPNSICEAQCLGVPVVSTNVGGIATLVRNGEDGMLVPANDPWQMADTIIEVSKDKQKLLQFSERGRKFAMARHSDNNIKRQLLECYNTLITFR